MVRVITIITILNVTLCDIRINNLIFFCIKTLLKYPLYCLLILILIGIIKSTPPPSPIRNEGYRDIWLRMYREDEPRHFVGKS